MALFKAGKPPFQPSPPLFLLIPAGTATVPNCRPSTCHCHPTRNGRCPKSPRESNLDLHLETSPGWLSRSPPSPVTSGDPNVIFFQMTGKNALKRPWPFFGGRKSFRNNGAFIFMSQGFCWSRGVCWMEVYGADLNFQVEGGSILYSIPGNFAIDDSNLRNIFLLFLNLNYLDILDGIPFVLNYHLGWPTSGMDSIICLEICLSLFFR